MAQHHLVNGGAPVIFVFAHPSTSYLDTFLTEALVAAGAGVLGIDGRYVERGAGDLRFALAAEDVHDVVHRVVPRGRHIVLVGHSGGAPLMALTQIRYRLGHRVALLAAHPSRAHIFEAWVDGSVREDGSRDPALDLYAEGREMPLAPEFVARYRAAQRARVQRLARQAADHLRRDQPAATLAIPGGFADARFIDRHLDPNARTGVPFDDPQAMNQRAGFMADGTTVRSFFDQWYRPTTSADLLQLAPGIDRPLLNLVFGADGLVFPSQSATVARALPPHAVTETVAGAAHNPRRQAEVLELLAERLMRWVGSG